MDPKHNLSAKTASGSDPPKPRACLSCRKLKARCDGWEDPPCHRCSAAGVPCEFVASRRGKRPPKKVVPSMSARIKAVEIALARFVESGHQPTLDTFHEVRRILREGPDSRDSPMDTALQSIAAKTEDQDLAVDPAMAVAHDSNLSHWSTEGDYSTPSSRLSSSTFTPRSISSSSPSSISGLTEASVIAEAEGITGVNASFSIDSVVAALEVARPWPPNPSLGWIMPTVCSKGIVRTETAVELFESYFANYALFFPALPRQDHTATSIYAESPFLFTVILAVASRTSSDPSIQNQLYAEAHSLFLDDLTSGECSLSFIQACLILVHWACPRPQGPSASGQDQRFSRSIGYTGAAKSVAWELGLFKPPTFVDRHLSRAGVRELENPWSVLGPDVEEAHQRDALNRERIWLTMFFSDQRLEATLGRPSQIQEPRVHLIPLHHMTLHSDLVILARWELSIWTMHLMKHFRERLHGLTTENDDMPDPVVMRLFSMQLEEWKDKWCPLVEDHAADSLRGLYANTVLFLNTIPLRAMLNNRSASSSTSSENSGWISAIITDTISAARSILDLAHKYSEHGVEQYSTDGHFIYILYASVFLLKTKVSGPPFSELLAWSDMMALLDRAIVDCDQAAYSSQHLAYGCSAKLRALRVSASSLHSTANPSTSDAIVDDTAPASTSAEFSIYHPPSDVTFSHLSFDSLPEETPCFDPHPSFTGPSATHHVSFPEPSSPEVSFSDIMFTVPVTMRYGFEDPESSASSSSDNEAKSDPPPVLKHDPSRPTRKVPARHSASLLKKKPSSSPTPFTPKPVHLVQQPKLPNTRGRGKLLYVSPGSSDDEQESGDDGLGAYGSEDDDEDDSEEEEWPVGPIGSIGVGGWRRDKGKGKAVDQASVYGDRDVLDLWDEKARANSWATANRTFHLSLARSHTLSPTQPKTRTPSDDVHSIQSLLSTLALAHSSSQKALVTSFEKRNADLWASIEASIRAAEAEEGERKRILEEKRLQQEESERKAKAMREEALKKAKAEKEAKAKQEAAEREKEAKEKEAQKHLLEEEGRKAKEAERQAESMGMTGEGSPKAEFERWTAKMKDIKLNVLPIVSSTPAYKAACNKAKRSITPKIGQLTPSLSATTTIVTALSSLLDSLRPPPDQPTATQPYTWALNHLSKALVKQAETEITARLETAYPLGRVVVALIARGHVELGDVLMARLVKKCFWITGWWPTKTPDQTDADHLKTLGHAPPQASESLSQYATRMSGLLALYASILSTPPLTPPVSLSAQSLSSIPAHFRPSYGWRWLVLILRAPLVSLEPTPLLIGTFLEIAGEEMGRSFGKQWVKVLEVVRREAVEGDKGVFSEKARSSIVKLGLWLEDWERGKLTGAEGRKMDP